MVFKLYVMPLAVIIFLLWLTVRLLKRSTLSLHVKRFIFVLFGSFISFPMLLAAPGMFMPIPAQNLAVLLGVVITDSLEKLPEIYAATWQFSLISWAVTALAFWGISMLVFRKYSLPKQAEKPI